MMQQVRVAVIGYGHLGRWHTQKAAMIPESCLEAIVEPDPAKQALARENHPDIVVVGHLDEVINKIDAAIVVTPTSTHFHYIDRLLQAKKHILCEKPLCASFEEVEQISHCLQTLSGQPLVLQCGHSERFHAVWDLWPTQNVATEEKFVIEGKRLIPFVGRACDVDVVQDLMIHDLDLLNFILKQNPISINATGYKLQTSHWDAVWAELTYANGGKAYLEANRDYVKVIRDWDMKSPHLTCHVDLMNCECQWIKHGERAIGSGAEKQNYEKRDHLLLEQQHFFRSILNNTPAIISFEDGLQACRLSHKVLESLESKKIVLL